MRVDWRTTIHMLIQRQFRNPCAIELRFEEVVGLRMVPPQPDCVTRSLCAMVSTTGQRTETGHLNPLMMGQPGWRPGGCTGGTQASGLARTSDIAYRAECATIFVPASQRRDTGFLSGGNRFRQGSFREATSRPLAAASLFRVAGDKSVGGVPVHRLNPASDGQG